MDDKKTAELNRIRHDLIKKADKQFDRTIVAIGPSTYSATREKENLKEGETWTDADGKQWTRQNGIVQSISKNVSARMPWWCPKCSKSMAHRLDRKFYYKNGFCMNCTIRWHTDMKLNGTYEAYEKRVMRENERAFLLERIEEHEDYIRTFREPQMHYSNGQWEKLADKASFKKTFDEVYQDIEFCKTRLQQISDEELNDTK